MTWKATPQQQKFLYQNFLKEVFVEIQIHRVRPQHLCLA